MTTPPPNSSTVVVDDTNPSLIYSGNWAKGGVSSEFNSTTHGSTQKGASVLFTFRGTSVSVYGTIGSDTPSSAYILDGSTPSVFVAGQTKTFVYQQLFFHSPSLTDGEHTLSITNMGSGELWIDYLLYTQSSSQPPSSSSSSSLSHSTTLSLQPTLTSSTFTPSPNSPTPNPPPTSSEMSSSTGVPAQVNSNTKSSTPGPAIAGGAIGALVLIIGLVFGLLYYRRRAKRLAGEKLLEKNNVFGGPPEPDNAELGAPVTPFTSAHTSGPNSTFAYGSPDMNMYPPGPIFQASGYNQSPPSTPIYHFSRPYSLRSGFSALSENIAGVGTVPGYGGVNHTGPQQGSAQYGYANTVGQPDYFQNPHSPRSGIENPPYTSSDRLAVPEHRNSLESAESHASLAYLSGDRVAMNPSLQLPDALPGSQTASQQSEKAGFIVHNPEIRQHEDGGVRLDVETPHPSGSQQQEVVELPPVYKPNY